MKISVELIPSREKKIIELPQGSNGLNLVKAMGLAPDVHIIIRSNIPIPIDKVLQDGDKIRIISIVSGG